MARRHLTPPDGLGIGAALKDQEAERAYFPAPAPRPASQPAPGPLSPESSGPNRAVAVRQYDYD
jgi:hypothetical protein